MTTDVHTGSASMSRRGVVALTLIAAALIAVVANSVVAFSGIAAGAGTDFAPLTPAVYASLTVVGIVVGYLGWRIVVRRTAHPLRVLQILVPVLLVLSLVPDTISLLVGYIPGTTLTGFVALMIMHPIVVAVGVPAYQRLTPAR